MPVHGVPRCGPCCKKGANCNRCGVCWPQTLCVTGTVTPANSGTGTGSGPVICCTSFSNRIPSSNCDWYGTFGCNNALIDVRVEVVDGSGTGSGTGTGECLTRVTSIALGITLYFTGALPAMTFSGTDFNGTQYDVTISKPDVVPNPLYTGKCAVCACASCLPAKLCARILLGDPCGGEGSLICPWNCAGWTGGTILAGNQSFSISFTLSETDCAVIVHISTGEGSGTGTGVSQSSTIVLETASGGSGDPNGFSCHESGSESDLEVGGPPLKNYNTFTIISAQFLILDSLGDEVGILYVEDCACNCLCEATPFIDCSGSCPLFEPVNPICSTPITLTAEIIAPQCPSLDGKTWPISPFQPADPYINGCQAKGINGVGGIGEVVIDCPTVDCPDSQIFITLCDFWYEPKPGCGNTDVDMSRYKLAMIRSPSGSSLLGCGLTGSEVGVYSSAATSSCPLGRVDFTVPLTFFTTDADFLCCKGAGGSVTIRVTP